MPWDPLVKVGGEPAFFVWGKVFSVIITRLLLSQKKNSRERKEPKEYNIHL